jgi:hypothetical protein
MGISMETIIRCEKENLDFEVMTLEKDEVEVSTPRDSETDVVMKTQRKKLKYVHERC